MSIFLALETSCDETSASIVSSDTDGISILSNVVSSQIALHAPHGGVIPNLAAREHTKNINIVIKQALHEANISSSEIDVLAVTNAPGLIPALLVGTTTAKTLSWLWKKPLLGIHHLEGHIYANFITTEEYNLLKKDTREIFPLLALIVSGGHTQLVLMKGHFQYEIIGETQDDAVGEAFDKTARLLGLGYPGGPEVSRCAQKAKEKTSPLINISLPRPMIHKPNFNFSFSGLKTAVLTLVKRYRQEHNLADTDTLDTPFINAVCAEFEQAAVDVLISKTLRALETYEIRTVVLAGGVSANTHLQKSLALAIREKFPSIHFSLPPTHCITDNAAMIGAAAAMRWELMNDKEKFLTHDTWKHLETRANALLSEKK